MGTNAMKETVLTLFLVGVLTTTLGVTTVSTLSSDVVVAVGGLIPTIDGYIGVGEWDDADTLTVSVTEGVNCTVYVKQDGVNLYVGFNIPDATYNSSDCCVIIFDVDHDGSTLLKTDDVWLRVSRIGVKVEYNVTASGWFPTTIYRWSAQASSTASAWLCEYNITYSKVNISTGTNKTLGVMFLIVDKDVEMGWYVWPSNASISKPATWGDMTSNGHNWVPEFSTWASLLLLLIVLTVVIVLCKVRLLDTSLH